jgi:hypothetical protein
MEESQSLPDVRRDVLAFAFAFILPLLLPGWYFRLPDHYYHGWLAGL